MVHTVFEQHQSDKTPWKWMSNSQKRTKGSMSIWQFTLLLTIIYIIGLAISHNSSITELTYWSGYKLERMNDQNKWVTGNRFNTRSNNNIQTLRFSVDIDSSGKWKRPVGLKIGGPFSAEVFWDNELIGNKGKVGKNKEEEIPGLIDEIFFVQQRMLTPGTHHIKVRLSTQHLTFSDSSVFHFIELGPYRESGRRTLRYYITPLIILSALILVSFQSIRIGQHTGNITHKGLGVFGFFVVVLLLSEISRAIVNYQYHFHDLRGLIGWFGNTAAGLTLVFICIKLVQSQRLKGFMYLCIGLVIITYFIPMDSGDNRRAMEFILLVTIPALVLVVLLFKKQVSYLSTLPLFCFACLMSNSMSTALFLDSFQFVAAFILIAGAWIYVYVKEQSPEVEEQNITNRFLIKGSKGEQTILTEDCIALKGEGNYTTLMLVSGEQVLHQDGLGTIMTLHPKDFVRVHKSYAVNLNYVVRLRSAPGSKYWLEMNNQQTIPVSRYKAVEIRSLVNSHQP
ncbi:LytR/AlgR family response regulator transcription factor [Pseudoalteromonas sp.]|uniref:LytR/AlgR family response regulator transcription factor n=1 Tax=Pseudoalteromonas sp. TaxID=53249 RepID=UPI003564B141